jgi:hypothetical protein
MPASSSRLTPPPPPQSSPKHKIQSLIITPEFQHILRILNTNVDGTRCVQYALTAIKGVGRRFSNVVCKKAEIDLYQRCVCVRACVCFCV